MAVVEYEYLRSHSVVRALAFALALCCFPGVASAHPLVNQGIEAANDGRFQDALDAFEQALNANDLTREDLLTLFLQRAIVLAAVRAARDRDADLRALLVIDPEFDLPPIAPPQIRSRFEEIRAQSVSAPRISVSVDFETTGTRFDVSVEGIPRALTRRIRVHARIPGRAWETAEGAHVEIPILGANAIEWYVEVIGPGGLALLSEGTSSSPRQAMNPSVLTAAADVPREGDEGGRSRTGLWVGIGGGAAAVLVLTTALILATRDSTPRTVVEPPVFR